MCTNSNKLISFRKYWGNQRNLKWKNVLYIQQAKQKTKQPSESGGEQSQKVNFSRKSL